MYTAPAALLAFDQVRHGADWKLWGQLAKDAPPFLTPEFFALMQPLIKDGVPLVAEAWGPGRVLGALPLVLVKDVLRAMRSDHSPSYDYCGSTEGIIGIWNAIRHDDRWNELVLDKVPSTSLLATELLRLARADGCHAVVRPSSRHPFFALAGFESRLSPKFRANLHRCARKAGDVVLERILIPSRADLAEATEIEGMAWKDVAGTSIAADPRVEHVYHTLGRLLGRRGRSALYFLRIGAKRVATLFAVEDQETLFALKIGYDPHYAHLSPGHLLVWKVAADAEARGLTQLDFVGHEDDWKRKWTDHVHELVTVVIYKRSAIGLVRYGLRELLRPRLPEPLRSTPRSPFPRTCQRANLIGTHTPVQRILGRLDRGLGIKSGVRRALAKSKPPGPTFGEPSRFPVGSWVRVIDEEHVRASLDDRAKLRGLAFVPGQWATCGQVFRVASHVQRIRDDHGRFRAVSRTVLLEGVDCGSHVPSPAGCGRHCPLMYRDEWLEPAAAPTATASAAAHVRHARVRTLEEIVNGLDAFGRRDGLTFMPEMAAYAGRRFAIVDQLGDVFELDRWVGTPQPIYLLAGLHCSGAGAGSAGPCHRACALMWHRDWLIVEPDRSS